MSKLNAILSKVLSIEDQQITDELSPRDVETWDSFNALMLVSELESAFNIKFTMDEVVSVQSVGDIKRALEKHGVTLEE